jgi:hypothetical protein
MNVVIDVALAKTLRETAVKKFGKMRGASLVIEEALRRYFREEGIDVGQIEENSGKKT